MIRRIGLLPLVRRRLPWLLGGLGLLLLTLASGLALLALSGWFIVSSALAGLGLIAMINIFTPGAGIRLFALTRTVARYGERLVSHSATFRLLTDLRMHVFEKLLGQDEAQLRRLQRSEIRSRLSADIDTLDHLYLGVANPGLGALLATALTLTGISLLTPLLALLCAGLFLLLNPAIALTCYISGRSQSEALGNALPELRNRVSEGLEARQELVALDLLGAMTGRIDRTTERINRLQQQIAIIDAIGNAGVLLIGLMTVWIALILALPLVHEMTLSGALAGLIILALLGLGESWLALPAAWRRLAQSRIAAARVVQIMDQPNELPRPSQPRPWPESFDIRIEALQFRYQAHLPPVIENLDVSIQPGERLVISGPSGCGKTTLVGLIMRQMDPAHGRIMLGGVDVRELDQSVLRQRIAYLPQRPVLFQDSLAANLRIAAPDASDSELHEALAAVGLADFVKQRPNGLEAWIDEAGSNVSGGEKRRIALARLFLTRPDIVILDEPMASLDHLTSQVVRASLANWLKQKTAILITHEPDELAGDWRHLVMTPTELIEAQ